MIYRPFVIILGLLIGLLVLSPTTKTSAMTLSNAQSLAGTHSDLADVVQYRRGYRGGVARGYGYRRGYYGGGVGRGYGYRRGYYGGGVGRGYGYRRGYYGGRGYGYRRYGWNRGYRRGYYAGYGVPLAVGATAAVIADDECY
jgi:hypothetical protein